jgi:hypothetical protein
VVDEIDGVVKLVPVPRLDPPVEAAYQFKVALPFEAAAAKETVPEVQTWPGVDEETVGMVVTVNIPAVDVAVGLQIPVTTQRYL